MKPVRIAQPMYDGNLADIVCNPRYSTVVGLLISAREKRGEVEARLSDNRSGGIGRKKQPAAEKSAANDGSKRSILKIMRDWFVKTF